MKNEEMIKPSNCSTSCDWPNCTISSCVAKLKGELTYYYLHNGQLFEIDRMPPDKPNPQRYRSTDGNMSLRSFQQYGADMSNYDMNISDFHAYLSTLQPIPHAFSGESRVIPTNQIEWRYEWLNYDLKWVEVSEGLYETITEQRRRVATPKITEGAVGETISTEGEKAHKIIVDGNSSKNSSSSVSKESFQTDFDIDMGNPTTEHPLQFLVDGYQLLNTHFDYPEDTGGYDMKRIIEIAEKSLHKVYKIFGTDRLPVSPPSPTPETGEKERCRYEKFVEQFYGLNPEKAVERYPIETDFGQVVSLLCMFAQQPHSPVQVLTTDEEAAEIYAEEKYARTGEAKDIAATAFADGCTRVRAQQGEEAGKDEAMDVKKLYDELVRRFGKTIADHLFSTDPKRDLILSTSPLAQQPVDAMAKEDVIRFTEWCNQNYYVDRDGENEKWFAHGPIEGKKRVSYTTDELYCLFTSKFGE